MILTTILTIANNLVKSKMNSYAHYRQQFHGYLTDIQLHIDFYCNITQALATF